MKSADLFWNVITQYHQQTIWIEFMMICIGVVLTVLLYLKPTAIFQYLMKLFSGMLFCMDVHCLFLGNGRQLAQFVFCGSAFPADRRLISG